MKNMNKPIKQNHRYKYSRTTIELWLSRKQERLAYVQKRIKQLNKEVQTLQADIQEYKTMRKNAPIDPSVSTDEPAKKINPRGGSIKLEDVTNPEERARLEALQASFMPRK